MFKSPLSKPLRYNNSQFELEQLVQPVVWHNSGFVDSVGGSKSGKKSEAGRSNEVEKWMIKGEGLMEFGREVALGLLYID